MAAAPGRRSGAAVVDERRMRGVVAVGLDAMAAGADVEVCVAVVHRLGSIEVPGQLLVELVPVGNRVHVRLVVAVVRVVVVLAARVAHGRAGMRPTCRKTVRTAIELILERHPLSVALPLVLELHSLWQVALHLFPQVGDGKSEPESVLTTDLHRLLVGYVVQRAVRGRARTRD